MTENNNKQTDAVISEESMLSHFLQPMGIESDCVLKLEVDKIKGVYCITLKFHHIGVKYTFDIDDDTFKNINANVMKLIAKNYKQIDFETEPLVE